MLPELSNAISPGKLNCPSAVPDVPNFERNVPEESNFWTR